MVKEKKSAKDLEAEETKLQELMAEKKDDRRIQDNAGRREAGIREIQD